MEHDSGNASLLNAGGTILFEEVFKTHFKALHAYAYTIVEEDDMAEEIVQNVFCKLWERRDRLEITQSVKAYLYKSVYHESINYLRHLKKKRAYQAHAVHVMEKSHSASEKSTLRELEQKLEQALKELPERCRTIFQMSRFESLKYQQIADQLGLSVKTVENQMGKALKILRLKLVDFLPLLLFFIAHLVK